jgi:hypothetical protein
MSINRELSQLASFIDVQESNNFIGISTGGTYTVGIGTSSVIIGSTGIITATQFNGPTGSSLIDRIDLQDEGSPVGTGFTTLNFVGTGVTITEGASGIATVTITGTAIIGTSGEVEVTDNGDGTTTLSLADEVGITSSLTVGTVKIESGIITATSGIVTYHGDGSGLTNINASSLSGIATDSDKLDGQDGTYYLDYANFTNTPPDIRWFGTAVGIWTSSSVGIGTTNATSTLTVDGTLNVSGVSTFQDNIHLGDNDKIILGDGNDLEIYHNGSNSYISDQGIGQLRILTNKLQVKNITDNATSAVFNSGGSVTLYHNNSNKFETTGAGVSVSSGTASTATIYGPGNLIIDPAPVDDNGGIVRIKGDLYVDGTTTEINSTTLTVDDLNVVVASGATNGLTADGAGLSVAGAGATIKYNYNGGGANEQWVFNKAPYYNTNRILTTADEGTGNGLDADTLDGQQGTYYLDYTNFTNTPTIPTVNDATLTLATSGNGISGSDTFTANQSTDTTFTVTVSSASTNQASTLVYRDASGGFSAGVVTATKFVKSSNSSGFLKADGTEDTNTYLTSYTETQTLDDVVGLGSATTQTITVGTATTGVVIRPDGTLNVSGVSTFQDNVFLGNNDKLTFGDSGDELQIYHTGSLSYISDQGPGALRLLSNQVRIRNGGDNEDIAKFVAGGQVELYHDNSKKFETTADGIKVDPNVGLGTTAGDSQDLAIFETAVSNGSKLRIVEERDINGSGWTSAYTRIQKTVDVTDQAYIQFNGSDNTYGMEFGNAANNEIFAQFRNNSSVDLYYNGSKKFETTGYGVTITGGINVSGVATATDFNSASDENLKTNIRTIEDPLAKVVQIRGVNFDWKETQRPALGVIAQEIEKVLPELVTDNGTKTVNYNGLIGLLIEAVKAQQEEIDILKSKIK